MLWTYLKLRLRFWQNEEKGKCYKFPQYPVAKNVKFSRIFLLFYDTITSIYLSLVFVTVFGYMAHARKDKTFVFVLNWSI